MIRSIFSIGFERAIRFFLAGTLALTFLELDTAPAAALTGVTLTVDTTTDISVIDGNCELREAITVINTVTPNVDCPSVPSAVNFIKFAIGSGPQTITPTSLLPNILKPIIIDATTQPGYAGTPLIQVDGASSISIGFNFDLGSANSKLIGFDIVRFTTTGVILHGGHVTLQQNYIGLAPDGTTMLANDYGVIVTSSGNHIGLLDTTYTMPPSNVISGNTDYGISMAIGSGNFIQANYIGTTADGAAGAGNGQFGILVASPVASTTIGGLKPGQGNVISDQIEGIQINSGAYSTYIYRNFIGTDSSGLVILANTWGIEDDGGIGTVVGGAMPAASNLVSGNNVGLFFDGAATSGTVKGNFIGVNSAGGILANNFGILTNNNPHVMISSNLIANNTRGIKIAGGTAPPANVTGSKQNCFYDNTGLAAENSNVSMPVLFASNWWGDASGPLNATFNPSGTGDSVGDDILFTPWLIKPPLSCLGWAPKSFSPKEQSFKNKSTGLTTLKWSKVNTAYSYDYLLDKNGTYFNSQTGIFTNYALQSSAPLDYGTYTWATITNTLEGVAWPGSTHIFYVTIMTSPKPQASVLHGTSLVTFKWAAYPGATDYILNTYGSTDCSGSPDPGSGLVGGAVKTITRGPFISGSHSWQITPNVGGAPTMPCWVFTPIP